MEKNNFSKNIFFKDSEPLNQKYLINNENSHK
jgi:hypothetical protein